MIDKELEAAVDATRAAERKYPSPVGHYCAMARLMGHRLVSLGCAQFRCVDCNERAFMDEPNRMIYAPRCKGTA